MDSLTDLSGSAPDPSYLADTGYLFQAKCDSWWATTVSSNNVRQEVRSDVSQSRYLFLRDFLFCGLHGLLNLVVKKQSVNKKAKKFQDNYLFLFNKLSN